MNETRPVDKMEGEKFALPISKERTGEDSIDKNQSWTRLTHGYPILAKKHISTDITVAKQLH